MGDSSDDEISFDDDQIDLVPLWRDSPLSPNNDPNVSETTVESSNDDNQESRVIELIPLPAPSVAADPLESLMNEINIMTRRVNSARIVNDRHLVGRPQTVEEEPSPSFSTQLPAWASSGASTTRLIQPTPLRNESTQSQRMIYRFSQLRRVPPGSGSCPNWARGRQNFPLNVGNSSSMNRLTEVQGEDEIRFEEPEQPEHHFVLPQAIAERERDEEIDDATRAERALFVRQLLLSSLTSPTEILSEAVKKAKDADKKNKTDSKKDDGASTSDAKSEKLKKIKKSKKPAKDAKSSVEIPSDLNKKN